MSSTYAYSQRPLRFASGVLAKPRHVCAFFHSAAEETSILSQFLRDGFARGEKAFDLVHPAQREQHLRLRESAGVGAGADGEPLFELRSWEGADGDGAHIDHHGMAALIRRVLDEGHAQGFPLTRLIAHMEWALDAGLGIDALLEYEGILDNLQSNYADPIVCSYDLSKWSSRVIADVMRTHPLVIVGGVLHENPFFSAPETLRAKRGRRHRPCRTQRAQPAPNQLAFELDALPQMGRDLSACLVHLLALPALFGGERAQAILDIVLDALLSMLDLELVYAEIAATEGHPAVASARVADDTGIDTGALGTMLAPFMSADTLTVPLVVPDPKSGGTLRAVCLPIGLNDGCALLAASPRADFPSSTEKLVLLLAANQAHLGVVHTRAVADRERAQREVERLYESERIARAETQRTLQDHEIFAGILAHDLRGPLNAILTTAQVLLRKVDVERVAPGLSRIIASGERMLRLIEQLLDFTRIRVGGGIVLRPCAVDLHALVRSVLSEIEASHPDWALRLHVSGDLQGTWDADRLTQVVYNLASNAVQHGVRDGGLWVELDGTHPAQVQVRVHNQGSIAPEFQEHLFDAFRGTQRQRDRSAGLGLGLFITHQIVQAHEGQISVESSDAVGTTFSVRLPRVAPVVDD